MMGRLCPVDSPTDTCTPLYTSRSTDTIRFLALCQTSCGPSQSNAAICGYWSNTATKKAAEDEPSIDDIYSVGTSVYHLQLLNLPDGAIKVLVEGYDRDSIDKFVETDSGFSVTASRLESTSGNEQELEVLSKTVVHQFEHYVKLNNKIPPEVITSL